ncbi:MAG: pyruvate kinase, partial [Polyangiaceae bacterium]|nr:pyruvate kinase [Polyangiaceae bacterium]
MRGTKIVCTVGPSTSGPGGVEMLVEKGMSCARLNFSHGSHDFHSEMAKRVRSAAERAGRAVSVLADLQGPKIRVGQFPEGRIDLKVGDRFLLSGHDKTCDQRRAWVSYLPLALDVKKGDLI